MTPNDAQMRPNWSLELQVGVLGSKVTLSEFVFGEIFLRKTEASINVLFLCQNKHNLFQL